jgi:hypothetical protein
VALGLALAPLTGCTGPVIEGPPASQVEVLSSAPGPDYVWIDGYWGWRWGHYHWMGGHWERPPRPDAKWVKPRWERRGDHYFLIEGYWR